MKKSDLFWQTYLNLEKEAIELSKYIYFTDEVIINSNGAIKTQNCTSQLETFSPYIADLLVRCCVQIEAISKELYFDNDGTKLRGDTNLFFDEDCLKLIDIKWKAHQKKVLIVSPLFNFINDENRILTPLKYAHKRQGTYWEKAYQAVKHDRFASMTKGNVKAFLHALAALYLLNIYYRNDSWICKYQEAKTLDYSMGSSIFAVNPPSVDQLWYGNNSDSDESPFICRYQDSEYQRIQKMQNEETEALNNYWKIQPELLEIDFQKQLEKASECEKQDPTKRVIPLWELGKYRLKKKIPKTLPFEQRKQLLINSSEWNGWIHQHNKHLSADEINEENIDIEIDTVGILSGMEIQKSLQKLEWALWASTTAVCKICIE